MEFFLSMFEQCLSVVLPDTPKLLVFIVIGVVIFAVIMKPVVFNESIANKLFLFDPIENMDPNVKSISKYVQIFIGTLIVNFIISLLLGTATVTSLSIWLKSDLFNMLLGTELIVATTIIIFSLIGFGAIKIIMRKLSNYTDKDKVYNGLVVMVFSLVLPYIDFIKSNTTIIFILFLFLFISANFYIAFVTQFVLRLPQKVCLIINGKDIDCNYRELKFRGAYVFIKHRDQNGKLLNIHRYKAEDITKLEYIY